MGNPARESKEEDDKQSIGEGVRSRRSRRRRRRRRRGSGGVPRFAKGGSGRGSVSQV